MAIEAARAEELAREALRRAPALPPSERRALLQRARDECAVAGRPLLVAELFVEEARLLAQALGTAFLREARSLLDEAASLLRAHPSPPHGAALSHVQGYVQLRSGHAARALPALLDAERAFAALGDRAAQARVLDTLGVLWDRRGDREQAAFLVSRALALKQAAGDRAGIAISLGNLGRIALHAGRLNDAEAFFEMDLEIAAEVDDRRGQSVVRTNLAQCRVRRGRLSEARDDALRAVAIAREAEDGASAGFGLVALAEVEEASGNGGAAIRATEEAEAMFRRADVPFGRSLALLARARVLAGRGAADQALSAAVAAARAARRARMADAEIDALLEAESALEVLGDRRRSRRFLQRARECAIRNGFDSHLERVLRDERAQMATRIGGHDATLVLRLELAAGRLAGRANETLSLRVVEFLGQGAFGNVFKVEDTRSGEVFALKRLRSVHDDLRAHEQRLRREFTSASRVDHPNVARPHGYGRELGKPCVLIDCVVPGGPERSLRDVLDRSRGLSISRALSIAQGVASGLHALHAAGIVHRDLKPDNVLFDGSGRAVLTDFGLALDIHERDYVPVACFKGTIAYAAPELFVAADDSEVPAPSPAADLYALGVMLYEGLTGELPVSLAAAEGRPRSIVRLKLQAKPPSLAARRPEAPAALGELVATLLAADPAARAPGGAGGVASRLKSISEALA